MTRCHAGSCTDPTGGPEPTADLGGMPAHPDCAAYEEALSADDETCRTCGESYPYAGDGYDGECPSCADRTYVAEGAA